jgi:hypothetical protein
MNKLIVLLSCVSLSILSCNTTNINPLISPFEGFSRSETVLIQSSEISVDYEIKSDLSITWRYKQPESSIFLNTKRLFIKFEMITMDNESIGMISAAGFNDYGTRIRPHDIIKPLIVAYPQRPKYLHAIVTKYNDEWTEKEEWFFNIDISNINVVVSGEEMKPGIFTNFVGQWVPETITLEDGQRFKANAYYLISSYRNGRKPYAIFKVNNDTEIIHNEDGKLSLYSGGLYLEEMRLREIFINGNSDDSFTLLVTPESRTIFKVKEGSTPK